jgi:hypothetical protein
MRLELLQFQLPLIPRSRLCALSRLVLRSPWYCVCQVSNLRWSLLGLEILLCFSRWTLLRSRWFLLPTSWFVLLLMGFWICVEREARGYGDFVCLEIVFEFSGSHNYCVCHLFHLCVNFFGTIEGFRHIINWYLFLLMLVFPFSY